MRKQGATSSSFDIIVASGYVLHLPHGVASEKEIQNGELVTWIMVLIQRLLFGYYTNSCGWEI